VKVVEECWVLTAKDAPYTIKNASDTWFTLWGFSPSEAIGKPVDIINGPGFDKHAAEAVMKVEGAVHRCRNAAKGGALYEHSLTISRTPDGILGTSKEITSVGRMGARDLEVFDDDMPTSAVAAPTGARRASSRDMELFDDDHVTEVPAHTATLAPSFAALTKQPSARDIEVFTAAELSGRDVEVADAPRRASGRDAEFDEEVPSRTLPARAVDAAYAKVAATTVRGARDMEVFECGTLPTAEHVEHDAADKPTLKRRNSLGARDLEY